MPDTFETIQDILNPEHSILVVWDVQNMLVENIFNKEGFMLNLNRVISKARKSGIPVVYTKITPLPQQYFSPARRYFMKQMLVRNQSQKQVENPLDLSVVPGENEFVMNKSTANIFAGTPFEMMLKNTRRETVIFTGIATEYGIETSARDTLARGYFPVIINDAVSSNSEDVHFHSLKNMKNHNIILISTEDLCDIYS